MHKEKIRELNGYIRVGQYINVCLLVVVLISYCTMIKLITTLYNVGQHSNMFRNIFLLNEIKSVTLIRFDVLLI